MKRIFNELPAIPQPIGHIIHIGAGQCNELLDYQQLSPQKIILVEADQQQFEALKLKTEAETKDTIEVLSKAISYEDAPTKLNILSNPNNSSLLAPTKLFDYYPSLLIQQKEVITPETLATFLKPYVFDQAFSHLLILEVQGLEAAVIQSLLASELQPFTHLIIRHSPEFLYQKIEPKALIPLLDALAFDCYYQEKEPYNAIFSKFYFTRNNEKIKLALSDQELEKQITVNEIHAKLISDKQAQLNQANKLKEDQSKLAAERLQKVEQLTATLTTQETVVAEKQAQLNQANKLKEDQSKLAAERLQKVEQLTATLKTQETTVAEKQSQLNQANKLKEDQSKLAAERLQKVEQLTATLKTQETVVTEKQAQLNQVNKLKEDQSKLAAERLQKVEQLTTTLKTQETVVAAKQVEIEQTNQVKIKSEIDLKDLQQRYQKQHELLNQLHEKLSLISRYIIESKKKSDKKKRKIKIKSRIKAEKLQKES